MPVAVPARQAAALRVRGLAVDVRTQAGRRPVLRGVDFDLRQGETLTLLGESGSGKSITANVVLGTLPVPPFRVAAGTVEIDGEDVLAMSAHARAALRGERIAMVFQDSMSAMNPSFTVGWQIGEMLRTRRGLGRREARARSIELMEQVRIPKAASRVDQYPHEFSGGMRQRAAIAMSLALDPEILIADEPTTALDVTIQAEVLELLRDIQAERDMSLLLITHDMGVAYEMSDRVAVMYAGRIVETAAASQLFEHPAHPYSVGLMASVPRIDASAELSVISGSPPDIGAMPSGCPFHPRCWRAADVCADVEPPEVAVGAGHLSRCHFAQEVFHE
ncbi:ABC transporter ATP-binding protein [Actinomycetota bacterium]|nr:ABC transporter ATP-binding protein [Actinomycetota bacterium]